MPRSSETSTTVRKALDRACALYEDMATNLTAEIMRLRNAEKHRPLEAHEVEVVRSFQKAVLMVLDFETRLLKRRVEARRQTGGRLDLAGARAEIARRLDRLSAEGSA
jgi:hypothetical protein